MSAILSRPNVLTLDAAAGVITYARHILSWYLSIEQSLGDSFTLTRLISRKCNVYVYRKRMTVQESWQN